MAIDKVFELVGDYNGDGETSGADFLLWKLLEGSTTDLRADGNDDGIVDGLDETVWETYYGNTLTINFPV